jgi:hypothetical protein
VEAVDVSGEEVKEKQEDAADVKATGENLASTESTIVTKQTVAVQVIL